MIEQYEKISNPGLEEIERLRQQNQLGIRNQSLFELAKIIRGLGKEILNKK